MNLIDLVAICPFYISLILEVTDFFFMDMIDHKNPYEFVEEVQDNPIDNDYDSHDGNDE